MGKYKALKPTQGFVIACKPSDIWLTLGGEDD